MEIEKITREEAELRIKKWQLGLLEEHGCSSVCETEFRLGVGGPHCGGIHARSDTELRQLYRNDIENIEELSGDELITTIIKYHTELLSENEALTCEMMAAWSRACDGLGRFTNNELLILFSEILERCEIDG